MNLRFWNIIICTYFLGVLTGICIFLNVMHEKKIIRDPLFIYPDYTIQNYYDIRSCIGVISKKDLQDTLGIEQDNFFFKKRREL